MRMKTLVLYDSKGGNTKKVAAQIHRTLEAAGHASDIVRVAEDTEVDLESDIWFWTRGISLDNFTTGTI